MNATPAVDPSVVDFVKALARANVARDIARLKGVENGRECNTSRRTIGRAAG